MGGPWCSRRGIWPTAPVNSPPAPAWMWPSPWRRTRTRPPEDIRPGPPFCAIPGRREAAAPVSQCAGVGIPHNNLIYFRPEGAQMTGGVRHESGSGGVSLFFAPSTRAYVIRSGEGGLFTMPDSLSDLEKRRSEVLAEISTLGDFRPGSISATGGRCGTPNCHCHKPDDPGHGPNFRLTYKVDGKTVTESFPNLAAQRKAEREVAGFRTYQQLSRSLIDTNEKICRARPVEDTLTPLEKKRRKLSGRKSNGK